jgi:hypothetical protein
MILLQLSINLTKAADTNLSTVKLHLGTSSL